MYCPSWHICKKRHVSGYDFILGIRDTASGDCSRDLGTTGVTVMWFSFYFLCWYRKLGRPSHPIVKKGNCQIPTKTYAVDGRMFLSRGIPWVFFVPFAWIWVEPINSDHTYVIKCCLLGWVHTCNVTAYCNTVSWQCGRDSCPCNVSKFGYTVTLRAFPVCCRYLAVASKGWYG
jgi:hypothetical protein